MDMTASTKRIFPFSLTYSNKGFRHTIGKDIQLTTSNAFYDIATVISIGEGLMMIMYTKLKKGLPCFVVDNIPLHQIKSCRLYK